MKKEIQGEKMFYPCHFGNILNQQFKVGKKHPHFFYKMQIKGGVYLLSLITINIDRLMMNSHEMKS